MLLLMRLEEHKLCKCPLSRVVLMPRSCSMGCSVLIMPRAPVTAGPCAPSTWPAYPGHPGPWVCSRVSEFSLLVAAEPVDLPVVQALAALQSGRGPVSETGVCGGGGTLF